MKRTFDLFASFIGLLFFIIPMLIIAILIKATSKGAAIYWSDRIGKDNKIFKMPKFRTMKSDSPVLATHLLESPELFLTSFGKVLRKTSLDELPQLFSILKGDMSFVGPRPALYNQYDLIELRTQRGIHHLTPGLTGWAQVNGRDEISILEKVKLDEQYLKDQSLLLDYKIIKMTISAIFKSRGIIH